MFVGQLEYYLSFANLKKIHKPISVQDFLEINAICSASIAAITTGAAAIATLWCSSARRLRQQQILEEPEISSAAQRFVDGTGVWPSQGGNPPSKPSRSSSRSSSFSRTQIAAEANGQTIFGRKLGTDRSNSCELGRVEEGNLCSRSGQHRSWYSPCNFETSTWGLGSHISWPSLNFLAAWSSRKMFFELSRSNGYFICKTGTENPFLLNSSCVNGLASSTFAVVMRANMQNIGKI